MKTQHSRRIGRPDKTIHQQITQIKSLKK
jgi:hypothetical protein